MSDEAPVPTRKGTGVPPVGDAVAVGPGGALVVAGDDAARLDRVQDFSPALGVGLAVEGNSHSAELPEGEEVDGRAPVIGRPEHDAVARLHAVLGSQFG